MSDLSILWTNFAKEKICQIFLSSLCYLEHLPKSLPGNWTNGPLVPSGILRRLDGNVVRIANLVFESLTKGAQSNVLESGGQIRESESLEAGRQEGHI